MRRTADYAFELPPALLAQRPAEQRHGSRLLALDGGRPEDLRFVDLVERLPEGAVLVVNDTKVIRARLRTHKESGGAVELLLVEPCADPQRWRCLARASKPVREGMVLRVDGSDESALVVEGRDDGGTVVVEFAADVFALLEEVGELPLPPYIERPEGDTELDRTRYQTVFARHSGAVAAPTAGLHFSDEVLAAIEARGIERATVTLHVGLGTFAPVRVDELANIELHEERYAIPEETAECIASGRPVVAVGTTVVRALESAAIGPHRVAAGPGRTSIFISPGYSFRIVDHLLTNFHLPESTLLMLVCAFGGYESVMAAYRHAIEARYRFYSYGDAMYLSRRSHP